MNNIELSKKLKEYIPSLEVESTKTSQLVVIKETVVFHSRREEELHIYLSALHLGFTQGIKYITNNN